MFVEIVYGLWSNSLGLLTDGAHMLLDCSAILIGLYCAYLAELPNSDSLNYGYKRSEVIGTFVNSVFLMFLSLYIIFESIERFFHPIEISSGYLILISFLGLLVNLVGIFTLHDFSGGKCNHAHHNFTDETRDPEKGISNHSCEDHDHPHQHHDSSECKSNSLEHNCHNHSDDNHHEPRNGGKYI